VADDRVSATTVIHARAKADFAVLANRAKRATIDGTGWVRGALAGKRWTAAGADVHGRPCTIRATLTVVIRWPTGFRCSTPRALFLGARE
jgi:hypothetical protein